MGGDKTLLKDKVDNIKEALIKVDKGGGKKSNKKSIENLIMIAIILIVTLIAINYILKDDKKKNKSSDYGNYYTNNNGMVQSSIVDNTDKEDLESRLSEILSSINGVRRSEGTTNIFSNK